MPVIEELAAPESEKNDVLINTGYEELVYSKLVDKCCNTVLAIDNTLKMLHQCRTKYILYSNLLEFLMLECPVSSEDPSCSH